MDLARAHCADRGLRPKSCCLAALRSVNMLALYALPAGEARLAAAGRGGIREVPCSSSIEVGVRNVASGPQPGGQTRLAKSAPNRAPRTAGMDDEDIDVLVVDDHPGVRFAIEALGVSRPRRPGHPTGASHSGAFGAA